MERPGESLLLLQQLLHPECHHAGQVLFALGAVGGLSCTSWGVRQHLWPLETIGNALPVVMNKCVSRRFGEVLNIEGETALLGRLETWHMAWDIEMPSGRTRRDSSQVLGYLRLVLRHQARNSCGITNIEMVQLYLGLNKRDK